MTTAYPDGEDSFAIPTFPEITPLSEAGAGGNTRSHPQHHDDLGAAVEALEANAAQLDHDHGGEGSWPGTDKLKQANTHQSPDTDVAAISLHHTLGTSGTQAAAGNHVHHYSQILDDPYIVCTSSTRPVSPFIGMSIYETDTNTFRVWANFPTNPTATGVIGSDNFHRTSNNDLDDLLWHQFYFLGDLFHGLLCTPFGLSAYWLEALTETNWCRARRVLDADRYTDSDDQELTVTHGDRGFDIVSAFGDIDPPGHDHYFRMSDDELTYCRVGIFYNWAEVFYTTNGHLHEISLGTLFVPIWEEGLIWTLNVIDWGFNFYRNGIFVGAIVDNDHRHTRGIGFRGWGFGHRVLGWSGGQHRPPEIVECQIQDVTSYVPTARWGLLPVASIPILVAESHVRQEILVEVEAIVLFDFIILDWFVESFFQESQTDMTITEPGVYHVHASIAWDPSFTFQDHSMISVKVNGQDIGRKNWEFVRGFDFAPGFAQTNEINFWWRFNAGDVVHVVAKHNADRPCWLWFDPIDPDRQVCHVELVFHSP